ncbi:MAG: UDP-3-O-acyl-N-acetylglucosamine deacetylase [Candidatus Omnitrophota bacterium]
MKKQRTIKKEISFSGKALQTGDNAEVILRPLAPNEGIVFFRADIEGSAPIKLGPDTLTGEGQRRSVIGGAQGVQTVEHFMAALWALGIDNIRVDIKGQELPALDGSAKCFIEKIEEAGLKEEEALREEIVITEKEEISFMDASITIVPSDIFQVSYFIDYNVRSIGKEEFSIDLDKDSFMREIAPARTFCLKKEAEMLIKAGLGKGADLNNTLVMDEDGPVGTSLRFLNEPVRHKILDLVGDLYMLGRHIKGKVIAKRSGHTLNGKMVQLLYDKYVDNRA